MRGNSPRTREGNSDRAHFELKLVQYSLKLFAIVYQKGKIGEDFSKLKNVSEFGRLYECFVRITKPFSYPAVQSACELR